MASNTPRSYDGPAILSYGFRPFFLMAALFAATIIPAWMAAWSGHVTLPSSFSPIDWHIHEMLFGYTSAVIAGFLFTAIPNWTGRMPRQGRPLALLAALWIAGRFAVAGAFGDLPLLVLVIDAGFLVAVAAMAVTEIAAGRNWNNLKVVVPVMLYLVANVVFHVEAMQAGESDYGRRMGFATVVFLIMLIGGRIIPSFTRNWLAKRPGAVMPTPFSRFDAACLIAAALALVLWIARPEGWPTALALTAAAGLHVARLSRWQGHAVWRSPILLMLHVAYAFLPLGFLAVALAAAGWIGQPPGMHLLGIGAIGGMTLAVMMRASLGHTGRALEAGPLLTAGFACIVAAALARALLADAELAGFDGYTLAALLWTTGFATFIGRIGPFLLSPNPARRQANG
ncbi:NnrS family protein [Cereibacter sphaeroides]|uniref:NnrS family protein n=1 Tax=Cereibacter sphaeroides TaxID=1063 RepID=UPI001F1F1411|nr:NnrS family protein [Cereibacter sphaeroides]MCE6960481.1 NnrS family protein [Cereibacter sphaeroides]MCE6975489.1 NnrS family protein [Cereibacter sphaeroides]